MFEFLKDSLTANVNTALMRLGGSRGFAEVRSRDSQGPIEIELKFRTNPDGPLITYLLRIGEKEGRALVVEEVLKYRRGSRGRPWEFLNLLCVEEPENQLYLKLLEELAEEFRRYAFRGGQVFVSTHSPDFLNAVRLEEVFWLEKDSGYTRIVRASSDPAVKS